MRRLLCLGVRSLQPVAVVLATVGDSECLALKLGATHDLWLAIAYELRTTSRLLNRVLPADKLLLLAGCIDAVHGGCRSVGFSPCSITLLQVLTVVDDAGSVDHRLTLLLLLLLEQLSHELVVLIGILILIVRHHHLYGLSIGSGRLHLLLHLLLLPQ